MPGLLQEPQFKHLTINEIGATFAAEIEGVDFSRDVPQEVFDEILKAITKVKFLFPQKLNGILTL
jgi:alpha-ketoglutarate-dependent 2,4-dichlorophenoxyacetate dioxygenase